MIQRDAVERAAAETNRMRARLSRLSRPDPPWAAAETNRTRASLSSLLSPTCREVLWQARLVHRPADGDFLRLAARRVPVRPRTAASRARDRYSSLLIEREAISPLRNAAASSPQRSGLFVFTHAWPLLVVGKERRLLLLRRCRVISAGPASLSSRRATSRRGGRPRTSRCAPSPRARSSTATATARTAT